ncbi:MAG: cobalamin B12-binding domain-containing protein [Verrucomicrobia bacterium]|nr:cobalamin B12-binding domain-containing protein [Verrucomicrobiota bacterium]
MEIILINPEGKGSYQGDVRERKSQYMFPYSLVFLQNYLAKKGVHAHLFDLFDQEEKELLDFCRGLDRPLVGITSQTYNRYDAVAVARDVKNACPSAIVVVGGKHFSYCAPECLEDVPHIDIVVRGEGEVTVHDLATTLERGGSLAQVPGITFRSGGEVVHNPPRRPEMDVEQFALDYSLLPTDKFAKGVYLRNYQNEEIVSLPLHFGRGCAQKCVFCSFGLTPYRVRKLDKVIADIIQLKERFDRHYFSFIDPSFCERTVFVEAFCKRLIEDKVDIKWYCEARADTPLHLLDLMARAGCISLDFAVETGSQRILETIRKRIKLDQVQEFAAECKKLGIRTLAFWMLSHPDEREEDAQQTLKLAEKLAPYTNYVTFNVAQVLPGTELETIAKARGVLPAGFRWCDGRVLNEHEDLGPKYNPLYLEHLSVDYIRKFRNEFEALTAERFTTGADLWRMVKKGLRNIPQQPLSVTLQDVGRFGSRLYHKAAAACGIHTRHGGN